jgi:hypothetical protein
VRHHGLLESWSRGGIPAYLLGRLFPLAILSRPDPTHGFVRCTSDDEAFPSVRARTAARILSVQFVLRQVFRVFQTVRVHVVREYISAAPTPE